MTFTFFYAFIFKISVVHIHYCLKDLKKDILNKWTTHFWCFQFCYKVGKVTRFHPLKALWQRTYLCLAWINGLKKTILIFLAIGFMISIFPDGQATFLPPWLYWWYTGIAPLPVNAYVNTVSSGVVRQCSLTEFQTVVFLTGRCTISQARVGNLENSSLHWESVPRLSVRSLPYSYEMVCAAC